MKVWVLGSNHPNADKSIMWDETFPNLSNCDILIVNLQTLTEELYSNSNIRDNLFHKGTRYIFDLLMAGRTCIFVLTSNQKFLTWLPIFPNINLIDPANIGEYVVDPSMEDFIKNVRLCNFYVRDFDVSYMDHMINPKSKFHESYEFTNEITGYPEWKLRYLISRTKSITNKAKQWIGGDIICIIRLLYYSLGQNYRDIYATGNMVFLPPPSETTSQQGIDLIINNLLGKELKESPPEWDEEIDLPNLRDIELNISRKEEEKQKINNTIDALVIEKNKMITYRRLLWTKGAPMEDVVKDAFIFLGFPEIRKIRSRELEDWVFEFKTIPNYKYGVIEVKGAEKRTALSDLTQCNKWVEDYMLEEIGKAKGIFIPNQYRLENFAESVSNREHFEPNETEYAEKREICILPSHVIFNAVVEKMKNNPQIARENIEKKIVLTVGLCKLLV